MNKGSNSSLTKGGIGREETSEEWKNEWKKGQNNKAWNYLNTLYQLEGEKNGGHEKKKKKKAQITGKKSYTMGQGEGRKSAGALRGYPKILIVIDEQKRKGNKGVKYWSNSQEVL